jgi:hypothetical protein
MSTAVVGGVDGVAAHHQDIGVLAQHSAEIAGALAAAGAHCHAALVDPDVLASAVLDPAGVARFEAALLAALDGPGGVSGLAAGFARRAVALRTAVAGYQAVDAARQRAIDGIRWFGGYLAGVTAPVGVPALLAGYAVLGRQVDWEQLVIGHPELVQVAAGAGPGLVSGLAGFPLVSDVPGAAHLVGMLYPDGGPVVTDIGPDDGDTAAPTGFGDLMAGLHRRNELVEEGEPDQIDVRRITGAGGTPAWVVDIPGTKEWGPPLRHTEASHDLGTNIHLMAGDPSTREAAVAEAMRRAGVGPADPVMLVGHSQGGMVAAAAARDGFGYNVTHVLTAGAPISGMDVSDRVQVLSLENRYDLVPHLDGAANPDRPNRTTVVFEARQASVGDNHDTGTAYLPAARALDVATDPSVQAWRDSAAPFLGGGTVQTQVYALSRSPR